MGSDSSGTPGFLGALKLIPVNQIFVVAQFTPLVMFLIKR